MNILKGTISDIQSSDMISLVNIDVEGDVFSSIILEGKKGRISYARCDIVNIIFKETEVGIAKGLTGQLSFQNRFNAVIKRVDKGTILSEVVLSYKDKIIESIISTKSATDMNLKENDPIVWLVKINEVSLMPISKCSCE